MTEEESSLYEHIWMRRFRDNLFYLLGKEKLTVKELAERTGISKSTIEQWLYSDVCPSAYNVVKIARGLGLPITDVIDYFY